MNTIKKILTVIFTLLALVPIPVLAEQGSFLNTVHDTALSDPVQEGAGRIGEGLSPFVKEFIIDNDKLNEIAAASGKLIKNAATAAPHAGWFFTALGRAYEQDYTGAYIVALNGFSRTTTVATVGATAGAATGIYVAGQIGASLGLLGGPAGAATGFVIGCGSAYVAGKIWDHTVGVGADVLDQKTKDWAADLKYAGMQGYIPTKESIRSSTKDLSEQKKEYWENPSNGPGGVEIPDQTKQATNEITKEDIREYLKDKEEVSKKELVDNRKELREKYEQSEKAKLLAKAKDLLEKAEKTDREADREAETRAARKRQEKRIAEREKKELSDKAKKLFEEAEKAEWEETTQEQEKQATVKTDNFDNMTLEAQHKALMNNSDEAWAGVKKLLTSGNPDDVEYAKKILTPTDKPQKSIKTTSAKKVKKKKVRHTAKRSHKIHPRKRSKHRKRHVRKSHRQKSRVKRQRAIDTAAAIIGIIGAVNGISNTRHRKVHRKNRYRRKPPRKSYKRNRHQKRPNKGGGGAVGYTGRA